MKFMNMIALYYPSLLQPISGSSGGGGESLTAVLSMATELLTWLITSMGSLLSFMFAHPMLLVFLGITLCGLVIGYFARIWYTVR